MSIRNNKCFLATAVLGALLTSTSVAASTINWSTVALSGAFPNFSFSDTTLGSVSLTYSSDTEIFGIQSGLGGVDTLQLGNTSGESLTMSWSNPVTDIDMEIWDIDAIPGTSGENVTFNTVATVSPIFLHSTDVWDGVTQTLGNDGSANPNGDSDNFSIMNFSNPGGFTSINFDWNVAGTGRMGIGQVQVVPLPSAIYLFGAGIIGLFGITKRKAEKA